MPYSAIGGGRNVGSLSSRPELCATIQESFAEELLQGVHGQILFNRTLKST